MWYIAATVLLCNSDQLYVWDYKVSHVWRVADVGLHMVRYMVCGTVSLVNPCTVCMCVSGVVWPIALFPLDRWCVNINYKSRTWLTTKESVFLLLVFFNKCNFFLCDVTVCWRALMTICRERVQGLYTSNQGAGSKGCYDGGRNSIARERCRVPPPFKFGSESSLLCFLLKYKEPWGCISPPNGGDPGVRWTYLQLLILQK